MIQINPLKSYIDGGVRAAITTPPSASLVFDLPGKAIWVKGVKLKGTDHTYIFSHDNYITLTNTSNSNESEDIKIGVNTSALKNAIDTTYGVVSTTINGLAPKFTSENKQAALAATTYYFLGWTGSTLKWYQAPFRNVRINSETTDRLGVNNTDPLIISSGNGISVTWDSTNKKIVITNTQPDVNHNTHYTTMLYIGENNDTKANKNVANPYLKLFDDSIRRATFQIKAGNGIAVTSDANGNITITNSSPDVNHNTDRTGIKLATVSGTKKTDSTLILANSATGLNIQGGTNKFLIGDGTNYIEVPVTPSFTISNKDATIGTTLTTIATIAGVDIKAKIASYSLSNHTHSITINGSTKTITTSGTVNLGNYLPLSGGTMNGTAWIRWADSGNISNNNEGVTFPVIRGGLQWSGQTDHVKLFSEETGRDNLNLVIQFRDDNSNGLSIRDKSNTQTSYISAGGVITTGTFKGNLDWSYITNKPSSYTPSAHTHAWNSLTHSSTTENQAILTNGSANGWKLYTLNISGWNNAANNVHSHSNKSVLDGITSTLVNNWNTAYNFVNTISGTDTDKVINKWDEIVNFLAGITEDNKLNNLLNSKLSVYELANNTNVGAIKNNGIYYSTTDASSGTLINSPFNTGFTLINMTSYDGGDDLRRSRLAFNAYGEIKVSNDRGQANTAETWYNVLTSNNSGISGSTIKLNGTSITVYNSSTADSRYVKKAGDTMSGVLTIDTTNFGALIIKRNDDTNGASIQFRGKSNVYGYIGLNNSTKDKQFLRWNSDTSKTYIILDTSSTYVSGGKGIINGTTITQVDNATNSTNSTNSTNARKLVNWYPTRPTSLNTQFGDGSLRIFYATSSTTEGKSPSDATVLHLAWDNNGGWDSQLGISAPSGRIYSRAQSAGTWKSWKTLAFTTDIPTSLKNPYALTISLNGASQGPYDGSAAKNINITPSSIGASSSNHTHSYLPLSGGTMTGIITSIYGSSTWINGVTNAVIKGAYTGYGAILSMPVKGGRVSLSSYPANDNNIYFGYATTEQINAGTNSFNKQMYWDAANNNLHADVFTGALLGNASTATKLTSSAGNAALPIYFSDGKPVACVASSIFSNLSNNGNNLSITIAGQNRTLTVAYASTASKINSRGNLTAYAEGSTTMGESGVNLYTVYNNGYPVTYGNLLHIYGRGAGQLLAEWCGSSTIGHLYYRSKRDNSDNGWSAWGKVAFITDNVASATTLQTTRTLWGQSFNGSANVSGNMSGVGQISFSALSGTNGRALLYQGMADNDFFRIYVGGTASNSGYAEIATADDGNEPIYVRQYSGVFSTLVRTLTLLDGSGNTIFPGTVTATTFNGNASSATKLQTARIIWGQSFNGTNNVNGTFTMLSTFASSGIYPSNNYICLKVTNGSSEWEAAKIGTYIAANNGNINNYPAGLAFYTKSADGSISSLAEIRLVIDANGKVGIGTTSPSEKLDINGNIISKNIRIWGSEVTNNSKGLFIQASDKTNRAYITYNGNVENTSYLNICSNFGNIVLSPQLNIGIGTTTPSYKLHVAGDIYTTTGFKKNGSSNSYVLLGGGGHKAISDFSISGHTHAYLPYKSTTTADANSLTYGLTLIKTNPTNAAHTNHSAFLYLNDCGTPFQIQIPDSSVMYAYKRYYSGGTWSAWSKMYAGYADSAGNADTVDGLHVHSSRNNEANKIVRTDGNGFIQTGWINTTSGDMGTTAATRVYCSNDAYIRYKTISNFRTDLVSGLYWANIKISDTSNSNTAPTFGSAIVNTRLSITSSTLTKTNPTNQQLVINGPSLDSSVTPGLKDWPGIGFHMPGRTWGSLIFNGNITAINSDYNGYINYYGAGFRKNGSSDSYILLGGGGHKLVSDFAISNHTHSWSSITNKPCTLISYSRNGENINANNWRVKECSLIEIRGNELTYSNLAMSSYNSFFNFWTPDGIVCTQFQIGEGAFYYRSKQSGSATITTNWNRIMDSNNCLVSKSGETLTVKINGISQSLTNTWRGIQDNLTSSTNTTQSLSAKQGYLLANGSARDNTKLPLSGGTMTGNITYTGLGTSYIGKGANDGASGVGGALNNLVISSWYGISFTTSCSGQTYTNKNAVSINCRNGYVYANTFVGTFSGNASTATALTTSAGSATLPIYFNGGKPIACTASSIFSNLSNSGNNISVTVAGQNRTLTVGYADDADTLDGNHASAFALVGHTHNYDNVYSKLGHTHDDRYYTESEINSKLSAYLPLAGGTMTGQIKGNNKGGSWIQGRANAALYQPRTTTDDWHPVVGFKTKTGSWEFGSVGSDDFATFSWGSDSNYNSGTNANIKVNLRASNGTIALTSEIPTVTNYYWANMKVSSTSSTSTSPTFSTCYTSNWFRSTGQTGWYNETYAGGWYMTDTTWVRTYNSKGIYTNTGTIYNLGHAWLACNNGYNVGIGTTSPSYKLHVSGDSYTTGWSRAASGFYCQDTGVHFTHNGTKGQIAITSNNEFCWGAKSNILYFNYATASQGTTVTQYVWNAGSSSSYASHTMGHITLGNGNYQLKRVGSASSWYNGRDKAIVRQTSNAGDYCVMMSSKTTSGSWEIGNEYDDLCFTHITDSNYNNRNNNYLGQIVFTSDGEAYAAHFYENSDIRYKKILKNLSINSNTIANLPLFDFEWIENNSIGTGTSAQAVQQILPNLVSGTDKLTLDYGVLGTIAGITACKELVIQKSELQQLKEKVKQLEDKLRKYENI